MNKFAIITAIVAVFGAGLYWYLTRTPSPSIADSNTTAETDVICHTDAGYFVIARDRSAQSEPGQDILIKHKSSASQSFPCLYQKSAGDIELKESGPTYFLNIIGGFLLLDSGTAPYPRGLSVYDIQKGTVVYSDHYNQPFAAGDDSFTYWRPIETAPTAENCPDMVQWQANGLRAGIEQHVVLDLATLTLTSMDETRCSARQ